MRKFFSAFGLTAALAAGATMTGWISDASCGASNANAKPESRDCAASCIKGGAAPVFVSDADQKVYKIAGDVKAADHVKYKVQVTGTVKGDTVTVTEIKKAD